MWSKYDGHVMLTQDTVYALPTRLIDEICESVPDFFSAPDEAFERDLADRAGTAFFMRHPLWIDFFNNGQENRSQEIDTLLINQMKTDRLNNLQIKQILEREKSLNLEIEARRIGYAGWLSDCASVIGVCKTEARKSAS
jgi:hypothetical protein